MHGAGLRLPDPRVVPLLRSPTAFAPVAWLVLIALAILAMPATASWMTPPPPYTAKDFTLVKRDGVYHLFYIRNNSTLPFTQTQTDFGHATSEDLFIWTQQDPVLPVRPGFFDNSHVWAPTIVERDSVYYMFYTGVRDSFGSNALDQRTGIATSTDLLTWNRMELPVLDCGAIAWAWCDSNMSTPFRDPFVMADPTVPGRWLMAYTSALASDPTGLIVGLATSNGDFTAWQDQGSLGITDGAITFSDVAESAHLFRHGELWFLFFTTNSGQPISFATTPDLFAPVGGWTYRGRLSQMLVQNTAGWIASEYFRDGLVEYFTFVNGDRIEISRMTWIPGERFTLSQPDLFHVKRLVWESASVRAGQLAVLRIESKWASGRSVSLESFWVDSTEAWHPVANEALGLPDQIPLDGEVHSYGWLARSLPDSVGAPVAPRIMVRTLDQTAVSNLIQVLPAGGIDPPDPPPIDQPLGGEGEPRPPDDPEPILRTLGGSMIGSLPAMLVDLPAEQAARLDLFDLQGRRVRTLADRRLPAGASVIHWDGRDANGRRLDPGLYFARLTTPAGRHVARLVLR